ncbi:hypothetical protein M0811_02715 [Anaeramoeba ignava]|uniref:At4g15545-like C-terminal domain-containing protein n=1 Tax=Anaeramoeba ignava TaxID=1746090 RepID=A0A9Q0R665_ANAIG|nr:hypothetical protein M0811_02715 [Anaeramoeba ignava]|eukprot:Anaeramoba_ignava/a610137_35.p1 GENE.a610137_35~~a610137_35.p1  ORF type:complete len:324 (-),score=126.55 a610137_35:37-1008(-)
MNELNLPSNPQQKFETGIEIIRSAFTDQIRALEAERQRLYSTIGEKDQEILKLKAQNKQSEEQANFLQNELRNLSAKQQDFEQKNAHQDEIIRKLRNSLAKLLGFKKAIIETVEFEEGIKISQEDEDSDEKPHPNFTAKRNLQENFEKESLPKKKEVNNSIFTNKTQSNYTFSKQTPLRPSDLRSKDPLNQSMSLLERIDSTFQKRGTNIETTQSYSNKPKKKVEFHESANIAPKTPIADQRKKPIYTPKTTNIVNTDINGQEFLRKARSKLSYDLFHQFLSIIKQFNNSIFDKETTIQKAHELISQSHPELFNDFQALLNQN